MGEICMRISKFRASTPPSVQHKEKHVIMDG